MPISPLQIIGTEWIWIVLILAVLLFGSKKLPEIAKAIGKAMGEFQRGRAEIEKELHEAYQIPAKQVSTISSEREKLENAAQALGINPAGKTDDQLRLEIQKALTKS